jgi:proton-translocating NADH-quinone oxidoreductase chain L
MVFLASETILFMDFFTVNLESIFILVFELFFGKEIIEFFFLILFWTPLITAVLILWFGRYFTYYGLWYLIFYFFLFSWFGYTISLFCFYNNEIFHLTLFFWINLFDFTVEFNFLLDSLSLLMTWIVFTISTVVHIYSLDYMRNDPHILRFILYLNFFTFFMLIFVTAGNFLIMFLGWEGIGLFSYLLITFWYTRIQANKSALKALIVNRLGDICLLLSFSLLFLMFGTLDYLSIFLIFDNFFFFNFENDVFFISFFKIMLLLLMIGAFGKSAQIGFHVWLPDAMEGPTPVSALLHAATMVTAGVFLIIRCSVFFNMMPQVYNFFLFIGLLTTLLASTTAIVQFDIKKIIAYSTCAHLGYMFIACGFGQFGLAFFHLFNHAFFKALLFLSAGTIIHALRDEQDIRKMGGLIKNLPLTYSFFLIASFSAIGFPYLSGFFSKDVIIELGFLTLTFGSYWINFFLLLSALLSSIYTFRLLYLVFWLPFRGSLFLQSQIKEAVWWVQIFLIFLAILSICSGQFFFMYFNFLGSQFYFNQILTINNLFFNIIESEFLFFGLRLVILSFSLIGIIISQKLDSFFMYYILQYLNTPKLTKKLVMWVTFFNHAWYFNYFYNKLALHIMYHFFLFYAYFDKGLFEFLGPTGMYTFFTSVSFQFLQITQTGSIRNYYFFILYCLFFIFLIFYFFNFNII